MNFSVLIPTKDRVEELRRCILSFHDNAFHKNRLEFIVRIDATQSKELLTKFIDMQNKLFNEFNTQIRYYFDATGGSSYKDLHKYMNLLAKHSRGYWLVLATDDCVMKTPGWDTIIQNYKPHKYCVINPCGDGLNLFPIVSRPFYEALGHISQQCHYDTYISTVAHENKIQFRDYSLNIEHVGTYNPHTETSQHYYSDEIQNLLKQDIEKIGKVTNSDK